MTASPFNAGSNNAGSNSAGSINAGSINAGSINAGSINAGSNSAGPHSDVAFPSLTEIEPGRRSRKKNKTRSDLMAAGAKLFATRGFDETTTVEIADLADVSQRTLFRHFPTKESLLYGDMEDLRVELRENLSRRPMEESILASVREALIPLDKDFEDQREHRLLQAQLAARYPSVSAYSRAVVQASWEREIIAAVSIRLGVDPMVDPRPEIVAGASMSAIRIATRQWTASAGSADYIELLSAALGAIGSIHELDL